MMPSEESYFSFSQLLLITYGKWRDRRMTLQPAGIFDRSASSFWAGQDLLRTPYPDSGF
jgi:hypothetical protein